jgi:hypothetical protein
MQKFSAYFVQKSAGKLHRNGWPKAKKVRFPAFLTHASEKFSADFRRKSAENPSCSKCAAIIALNSKWTHLPAFYRV